MAAPRTVARDEQPGRGLPTFAALASPNYRVYWIGLVQYVLGYRAEFVTSAWIMWQLTHDPLFLGYLGLAQGAPITICQILGGVLADRARRLRLLLITQVLTGGLMTGAFLLTLAGLVRVEHLLVLSVLSAICRALDEPSRMALIPQLIDRPRLANAIALGSLPWQGGRVIGPSITGILLATLGGPAGFAFAALASVGALVCYSRIRVADVAGGSGHGNMLGELLEGLAFVRGSFLFRSLILLAFINSFFAMSYVNLLPIFADVYFAAGSTGYGLLQAAHGAGAVVGSLVIATLGHRLPRREQVMLVGAAGTGLLLMVFSQASALPIAVAVLTVMGVFNTCYLTIVNTVLQQNVPDALRGRVMSMFGMCFNLIPLGGLLAGGLAAAVDARFAVLVGGAVVAVSALLLMTRGQRLRAAS